MNYVLFVHDHRFKEINNKIYSPGGLSNEILTRYTNYYGNIKVVARIEKYNKKDDKFSEITNKNIEIINYNSLNKKELQKIILNAQIVILRVPSFLGNKIRKLIPKDKKYIIEVVACAWDALWNHSIIGKVIAPIMYYKEKKIVKDAQNVIYVSNEFLQRRYPNKNYNVGCSDVNVTTIDKDSFNKKRQKKNNKKEKIVLGTCAALNVKYKGQQYVLKAISNLKKQGINNIKYELVGGGNHSRLIKLIKKYKIEDKVEIIGSLPHDKIFDWLDKIDIYIQPSNQEGLCRALIEAMSRGTPCIASNAGGNVELIDEEYIFRRKNVKELQKLILNMTSNNEILNQQATSNLKKAEKYNNKKLEKIRDEFYINVKNK